MTDSTLRLALAFSLCVVAATACKKEEEQPPPVQAGVVQQQPYGQTAQPGYAQPAAQPGYAQPAAAQPVAAQPVAAQPAAGSPTPSALATACKSDAECIGAKCNVAAGKCQFPCGSNNDCQAGWSCALQMGAVCMPAPGTVQQQPAN